ncbi:hypothetical protein Ppa06_57450 [Planomonospora parontospora subsp. parontospora]|uniref:Uncharacterized protein n=2 Tax=Planomonospora parontospora TaxID=58119 RepID=A0AA37BMK9_9ACTN|nr:hypothetical protein [Planomonospora parontospora]GGK90837.1 hypothetical protein GCM10010126_57860 [Planomonospora parontospora]GII11947.1 hypothetical protein Ppa06_57450 [Planomonospora parontospora subsp. parontospora]
MLPDSPTFGTIWYAKGGVYGPEPVMVISSPAMPRLAPGRVAVVQVVRLDDPWPKPHPMIAETIPGVGIAALTDFTTIPQGWFIDPQPFARLDPSRHADVARRIRNLIGP